MKKRADKIKKMVRDNYAKAISKKNSCCCSQSFGNSIDRAKDISRKIGYSDSEISAVPEGANLGFGCGNPVALAALKEGDIVLDLGSGAGFDAFLAAKKVGKKGRIIGVDMTPEMIAKAKANAEKGNYSNVDFRLGEIENLPVEDDSVDVVISNCVINLSVDKQAVFKEAYRVLKGKGSLIVSDLVLIKNLPDEIKKSVEAYVGCLAGAMMKDEYLRCINDAGFQDVTVLSEADYPVDAMFDGFEAAQRAVVSVKIKAVKR